MTPLKPSLESVVLETVRAAVPEMRLVPHALLVVPPCLDTLVVVAVELGDSEDLALVEDPWVVEE